MNYAIIISAIIFVLAALTVSVMADDLEHQNGLNLTIIDKQHPSVVSEVVEKINEANLSLAKMSDADRQQFTAKLKESGLSDKEIAELLVKMINESKDKIPDANKNKFAQSKLKYDPTPSTSGVPLLQVDKKIKDETLWWPYLIADEKGQNKILIGIEGLEISEKEKESMKSFLVNLWEKYQFNRLEDGGFIYITPLTDDKQFQLSVEEKKGLEIIGGAWSTHI